MSLDARYLRGLELFNAGEYFACHDELEEVWADTLGPDRIFYQGLIHAAVALFHFEGGNLGGARKMHDSASNYLSGYTPAHLGIDVGQLLADMHHCFRHLLGEHNSYPSGVELDESEVPQIRRIGDEFRAE